LSPELALAYDEILAQRKIASPERNDYKKWLRNYLNFCHKYQ